MTSRPIAMAPIRTRSGICWTVWMSAISPAKRASRTLKAGRTWVMDRGIPTEAVLAEMRSAETPTHYLVGTPRGRLNQLEQDFLTKPWAQVRDAVQVKLVEQDGELYILARSGARRDKEQAMRISSPEMLPSVGLL